MNVNFDWFEKKWSYAKGDRRATTGGNEYRIMTRIATNGQYIARVTSTKTDNVLVAEADEPQPTDAEVVVAVKKACGVKLKVRT